MHLLYFASNTFIVLQGLAMAADNLLHVTACCQHMVVSNVGCNLHSAAHKGTYNVII